MFERLYNQAWLRKVGIIVVLIIAWEIYARHLDNPLLVPTFSANDHRVVGRHEFRACCRTACGPR